MRIFKHIALLALLIIPWQRASADHYNYEGVVQAHAQCIADCEDDLEQGLEGLSCNYRLTQSAYQSCVSTANAAGMTCRNRCNIAEDNSIEECRQTHRDDRKECREDKVEETEECRASKKVEKKVCKQNKIDEKEACKELSGNAKRECQKQARQNKSDCKKQVRETKRACKKDAREEKAECKDDGKDTRDSCISQAESVSRACRDECNETQEAACVEQRQAANACAALARPLFDTQEICREVCEDEKSEALEGYNALCPNGHAGDEGATVTFANFSGEPRYYYKNGQRITVITSGASYNEEVACEVSFRADFKRENTPTSNFIGTTHIVGPFPCCEDAQVVTLPINPNGAP